MIEEKRQWGENRPDFLREIHRKSSLDLLNPQAASRIHLDANPDFEDLRLT